MSYIKGSTLEKLIQKQVKYWENYKKIEEQKEEKVWPFITISREYGCVISPLATKLAQALNEVEGIEHWQAYDRNLLEEIVKDTGISEKLIETIDTKKREEMTELMRSFLTDYPPQVTAYKQLVKTVRSLCIHGRAIIVGRAGVVITRGLKYGLHLRFVAPLQYRVKKIMEVANFKDKLEAEKFVIKKDRERHDFLNQYIRFESENPASYDLTFNVARFTEQEIIDTIIGALRAKGYIG
ncbi:MAG: cytidylate kinase-like family protein [Spirochaetes bacterium]|nr:cytidylate kinase-like family protein [Spirochaetota bacterium]